MTKERDRIKEILIQLTDICGYDFNSYFHDAAFIRAITDLEALIDEIDNKERL